MTFGLLCPRCGGSDLTVRDSRPTGVGIRRRRICQAPECGQRFTTFEIIDPGGPVAIVPSGTGAGYVVRDLRDFLSGLRDTVVEAVTEALKVRPRLDEEEDR